MFVVRARTDVVAGLCALLAVSACGPGNEPELEANEPAVSGAVAETNAATQAEITALRAVAEKYMDESVALAEGYIPDPSGMCITAEMEGQPATNGAMGIHYLRPDLLGLSPPQPGARIDGNGTHTDFGQPAILLYEPQMDGSMALVGVENLVWEAAWQAAGNTAPPSYLGNEYVHMVDDPATPADEAHGFQPHYELHAWVVRDNPNGVFTPFNPAVTCDHHGHAM